VTVSPILFALACGNLGSPPPRGVARISPADLRADVAWLASDELRGRATGSPELARAAEYLAKELRAAGFGPLPGDDDLFHDYRLFRQGYDRDRTTLALTRQGTTRRPELGRGFRPFAFSDAGAIEGELVFAGYGIHAPDLGYDDYEGLDVEGRVVLVLRHEPGEDDPDSPFAGPELTDHARFDRKAIVAAQRGAIGYLLVTDPLHHEASTDLRLQDPLRLDRPEPADAAPPQEPVFRAAHISRDLAEWLVEGTGKDLATLQRGLDAGTLRPADVDLGPIEASLAIERREEAEEVVERNVVAMRRGRGTPDEWVVIGAHYDHLGGFEGEGDTIYNGADDNASGTAGILALARAFGSLETPPRRSIVIQAYSGEERGLLGSEAWVRDHGADNVVFMLNLDMIGRNPDRPVSVIGDGYGTGVAELVRAAGDAAGIEVDLGGLAYRGNSDHDPFYRSSVPFLHLFTGLHDDYHQLGDHVDKVDFGRMTGVVRAAYHIAAPIAQGEVTPSFVHRLGWLGASLQDGVFVQVDEDSRAHEAGVREGDALGAVRIGDDTRDDSRDDTHDGGPTAALRDVEPGTRVELILSRSGETVTAEVERRRTGFVGIGPGPLSDEERAATGLVDGSGVKVRRLVPEGPAASAGLEVGDIIVQIGGRTVGTDTLRRTLQRLGAGEEVDVAVIRDGERVTLPLVLGARR